MKNTFLRTMVGVSMMLSSSAYGLQPGQSQPKRVYAIGDSITRGFDAYLPLDNKSLSWSSGYYNFWERLLGLPNVNSHFQRIQSAFGKSATQNWLAAEVGAEMGRFASFASGAAGRDVTYATVLLGANDVCADSPAALPTDAQFEADFRGGMERLLNNLPNGATIMVAAIPDIEMLYRVGLNKNALGLVNCPAVWSLGSICQSMLDNNNTEADRQYVKSRNLGYNTILQRVTAEYQVQARNIGKTLFISFSDGTAGAFTSADVSDIDCFHPSEVGQKVISQETWKDGFFAAY